MEFKSGDVPTVEFFAKELHEAGRAAVVSGATVGSSLGEPSKRFLEWDEISEKAREGRRIQARYLLHAFRVTFR